MDDVSYCHSLFYGTGATEDLATALVDSTYNEMTRVLIVSSGSEAIEAALKQPLVPSPSVAMSLVALCTSQC